MLTIFWTIMSVLSLSAFTSVVSSRLTVSQLAFTRIDTLSQVPPTRVCVEASYPMAVLLVSDHYGLDGDLAGAGVMQSTVEGCASAVIDGTVLVYVTDEPVLAWLAYSFYGTGNLYVSPTIRANPLTFAYPAGSRLRPVVDAAVIKTLTNTTWVEAREALASAWFPEGFVSSPNQQDGINMPWLAAAVAFIGVWLFFAAVQYGRKVATPLARVSVALRTGQVRQASVLLRAAWRVGELHSFDVGGGGGNNSGGGELNIAGAAKVETACSTREERAHSVEFAAASAHAAAAAAATSLRAAEAVARDMDALLQLVREFEHDNGGAEQQLQAPSTPRTFMPVAL
jgi:hypothetical protein